MEILLDRRAFAESAPEIPPAEEGPAWTWDAWTDSDTWELGPDDDGPAPDPAPAGHTLADEAWHAAFCLAMEGESPAYPHFPALSDRVAYLMGRNAGTAERLRREREDRDEIESRDARFEAW